MTLFEAYVMVDWSAASKPKQGPDSVWVAVAGWEESGLRIEASLNPPTRAKATRDIQGKLEQFFEENKRVLVGFDFAYGYPQGLAAALRVGAALPGTEPDWSLVWRRLVASLSDHAQNTNNRFEVAAALNAALGSAAGPFWGCPGARATRSLAVSGPRFPVTTRSGRPLGRYRLTEERLRSRGAFVQGTWKLYGNGSVGSQSLVGIPRVAALRWAPELDQASAVWPFETGFGDEPGSGQRPFVLHAEIWPGLAPVEPSGSRVKDQAQVEGLVRFFADRDKSGELGRLFAAPDHLKPAEQETCTREEGWILGA